jgi:hypothetical protein
MAARSLPYLPYLVLLFPPPHLYLTSLVLPPREVNDVGAGVLVVLDTAYVVIVLILLKFSWIRLGFKWAGLILLLTGTITLLLLPGNVPFTIMIFGGWLVLLALSGLWLYNQRGYLD